MIQVDPIELYSFLKNKDINYLYHANTVATSCTFINYGGLLSRGTVEKFGLYQTPQASDLLDKQFNVWNDIFIDVFDLHGYFPRQNFYGPVCFKLNLELLLDEHLPNICITKNNPQNWNSNIKENNYIKSVEEYKNSFDICFKNNTIQQKMITIRKSNYILPFEKYLHSIILDNPGLRIGNIIIYDEELRKIREALIENGLDSRLIKQRQCKNCYCKSNYKNYSRRKLEEKFF